MLEKRAFSILNQDSPDKDLKPFECREIHNLTHRRLGFGISSKLELIQGTLEKSTNLLPTVGENKTVGAIEDVENRKLYYFLYNTTGKHGIYEFEGRTGIIVKIMETGLFNFDSERVITGTVLDGMLFFTDAVERPCYVNVAYAKAGNYILTTRKEIEYYCPQPVGVPLAVKTLGGTTGNKVDFDSYKFAFHYEYFDRGVSRISHFSKLVPAEPRPDDSSTDNWVIRVTSYLDVGVYYLIKKIRLIYQKNNDGNYYVFKELDVGTAPGPIIYDFDGTESVYVIPTIDIVFNENIPNTIRDFSIKKNRLFMTGGKRGLIDDSVNVSLTAAAVLSPADPLFVKRGGIYNIGIVWENDTGWKSQVQAKTKVRVPFTEVTLSGNVPQGKRIEVQVNGQAPSWTVRSHLVVSREFEYKQYMQCPVFVMLVAGKTNQDDVPNGQTELAGWNYYNNIGSATNVNAVHLKIPVNLPFYPESGMFVRFMEADMIGTKLGREAAITNVVGDKIYIDNMDSKVWTSLSGRVQKIEIYSKNKVWDDIYFEVGVSQTIALNPNPLYVWQGDAYTINPFIPLRGSVFDTVLGFAFENEATITAVNENALFGSNFPQFRYDPFESPSPTTGPAQEKIIPEGSSTDIRGYLLGSISILAMDYKKIDNDRSIPHVEGIIEELDRPDLIIWSRTYIQETKINGLFNVDARNEEVLGAEEGKILYIEDVGEQILLAIQERGFTSCYVGQGVLRTYADQDIITKEDSVIGYFRRLKGRFGTSNPESIAYHDDKVWVWDGYRAEIVRYAANGLEPLGKTYNYKSFLDKIVEERSGLDYKAYGAYDPEHEEYYLSFPEVVVDSVVVAQKVTVRFSEKYKGFDATFDIYPDYGHKVGSRCVFWKDGKLYLWQKGSDYTFFGAAYSPRILLNFAGNQEEVEKLAQYFMINSDKQWRLEIESPSGAVSYIDEGEFEQKTPGTLYQDVYRDINSLGTLPDSGDPRFTGDTIRGESFKVTLTRLAVSGPEAAVNIDDIIMSFQILEGQLNQG